MFRANIFSMAQQVLVG